MKTKMARTSLIAYNTADITGKKLKVLQVFQKGYILNAFTVSALTGLPLQSVTGRINELRYRHGLVIAVGKDKKNRTLYRLRKEGESADVRTTSLRFDKSLLEVLESIDGEIIADNGLMINGKKYYTIDEIFKLV